MQERPIRMSRGTVEYQVNDSSDNFDCLTIFFFSIIDAIPARVVLYFLSWSGFLVSFMMRNDINLTMIAMVKLLPTDSIQNSSMNSINVSLGANASLSTTTTPTFQQNITNLVQESGDAPIDGEFDWSSKVQSSILSSFYIMYVLSQVVGGVCTQYFGTKHVFGWSQLVTAICSLLIPTAASTHYTALVVLRCIQGFASGLTWPAMYSVVGHWIPPQERSRFMSSFQGFSIGIGLTYAICGFIIASFGWRQVFYTTGTVGVLWCIMWYFLAFNTPAEHPRITAEELQYIEDNCLAEVKDCMGSPTPWKAIFLSWPAWAIGITTFGRIWVHYTFIMNGPLYMKTMLNFNIQQNGLITGIPFICSYLSSVLFCYVADVLVKKQIMSLKNVRKLFTATSQIIPGLMVLLVGYLGNQIVLVIILWFSAVTLITASYAGAMASIVDIAPNYAGQVLAFCQTIHMSASFVAPVVSGFILTDPV
jgi:MFS family permease